MRIAIAAGLLAVLLGLTPAGPDPAGDAVARCSIAVMTGGRGRGETILLAEAQPDTVLAGPGSTEPSPYSGHTGPGGAGPIHAQVFRAERLSGADSARLTAVFQARSDARVLIVPWDYDPSCQPTRWTRGAAWVPAMSLGTFTVELRPESQWLEGTPIFDAFMAVLEPYPSSDAYRHPDRWQPGVRTSDRMGAEDYFTLISTLLPREDVRAYPDSAWNTFLRWQRDHPDLAHVYPANAIEDFLGHSVSAAKARRVLRSIDPVIAGTWRMTASLDGGSERTFYVRTRGKPIAQWHPKLERRRLGPIDEPERPAAYLVWAQGAPSPASLPTGCREPALSGGQAYMYVIDPPPVTGEERKEWRGWIETALIARQFPEDSAYASFGRQALEEWRRRRHATEELEAPARYRLDEDGRLRVDQTTRLEGGRELVVSAERIATTVVPCDV